MGIGTITSSGTLSGYVIEHLVTVVAVSGIGIAHSSTTSMNLTAAIVF